MASLFSVKDVCGERDHEIPSWRCYLDEGHWGPHSYCPFRTDLRPVPVETAGPPLKGWTHKEAR